MGLRKYYHTTHVLVRARAGEQNVNITIWEPASPPSSLQMLILEIISLSPLSQRSAPLDYQSTVHRPPVDCGLYLQRMLL